MYKINDIEDIAKNTQKLFFIYLSIFSYCIITILAIKDRQLILTELNIILPLLNVGVPLNFFFIFGPILCTLSFLYFIINYMQFRNEVESWIGDEKLNKDKKNELIKISSKYILLTPISKIKQIYREQKRNIIIKKIILLVFIWWLLPVVLLLFTLKYIKTHEIIGMLLLSSLTIISIWIGSYFYLGIHWFQKKKKKEKNLFQNILFFIIILFSIMLGIRIFYFFYNAKQGITKYFFFNLKDLGYCNTVDLSYQSCINNKSEDVKFWGKFRNLKLEGANLEGAYLKRIDFKDGNFKGAKFSKANLDYADLSESNCEHADFSDTNMEGTIFKDVSADYAKFNNSTLIKMKFENTNLNNSIFDKTLLKEVEFLESELISSSFYDSKMYKLKFTKSHLEGADFSSSWLINSDFTGSNLTGSCFKSIQIYASDFNSDLELIDFQLTTFYYTNFCTNKIDGINFNEIVLAEQIKNIDNTSDILKIRETFSLYNEATSDLMTKRKNNNIIFRGNEPKIFYNNDKDNEIMKNIFLKNFKDIKPFKDPYKKSWSDFRILQLVELADKYKRSGIEKLLYIYGINQFLFENVSDDVRNLAKNQPKKTTKSIIIKNNMYKD